MTEIKKRSVRVVFCLLGFDVRLGTRSSGDLLEEEERERSWKASTAEAKKQASKQASKKREKTLAYLVHNDFLRDLARSSDFNTKEERLEQVLNTTIVGRNGRLGHGRNLREKEKNGG